MPLFGSKHKKHNDATTLENTTGGGHHRRADNQGLNNNPGEGTGVGMGPGFPQQQGMGGGGQTGGMTDEQALPGGGRHNQGLNNNPGEGTGVGMGPGFPQQKGMGGVQQQGMGGAQRQGMGGVGQTGGRTDESNLASGGYGQGMTGQHQPANDPYAAGGVGTGHHTGAAAGIPPSGTHSDQASGGGGTGQRITGKVESAIGTLVGSNALKAKGLEKEQEANSVKLQAGELAEAEGLEREALMHRERAVGHGAHPANSQLGAGHSTAGTGAGPGAHN